MAQNGCIGGPADPGRSVVGLTLLVSLNFVRGEKALTSSISPKNLTTGVDLVWSVAFECTSCADGLIFPRSKVENTLIFGIDGALGITLSTDSMALELKASFAKFGDLRMEATFLKSPPLGLKIHIPMEEVGFGASFGIGKPCQDNERTTLCFIGL